MRYSTNYSRKLQSFRQNSPSSSNPYKYDNQGNLVPSSLIIDSPSPALKYRDISHKLSSIKTQCKTPNPKKTRFSIGDYFKTKLSVDLSTRQIFVMKSGSSVAQGSKLPGFNYEFSSIPSQDRFLHLLEMKKFYKACQNFFQTLIEFKFLFSHNGKILHCLHEADSDAKVVIVSHVPEFQGVNEAERLQRMRRHTRSPCYKSYFSENSVMSNIESHFAIRSQKISHREKRLSGDMRGKEVLGKFVVKPNVEVLKLKLGSASYEIDKTFPTLCSQGVSRLKKKYGFKESELHSLYGKFKLLVLLSCGIDTNHVISTGINKETFVSYYSKSKQVSKVFSKIFDRFDNDCGGTVSWEEFLQAMNIIWHGDYESQLDLFFSVYDLDGNGKLSFHEIQELCKLQLQMDKADQLIDELSYSFASLIFDLTGTPYNTEIPAEKIKEIVKNQKDKALVEMFCSFNCLK